MGRGQWRESEAEAEAGGEQVVAALARIHHTRANKFYVTEGTEESRSITE